jgi:hypothetical protein
MPDELNASVFEPHVGATFQATPEQGEPVPLLLVEVAEGPHQPGAPQEHPFSLWFTAPAGTAPGQGMYGLRGDAFGRADLFLVPRDPGADGLPRLEAVVN